MKKVFLFLMAFYVAFAWPEATSRIIICFLCLLALSLIVLVLTEFRSIHFHYNNYKECFQFYNEATSTCRKEYYRNILEKRYINGSKSKLYAWMPKKMKKEIEDIYANISKNHQRELS